MTSNKDQSQGISLPSILSRIPEQLPEELVFTLLAPLITPSKESRDHHLLLRSPSTSSTAQIVRHLTTSLLGLVTTSVSLEESTSPIDLVKSFFSEEEYKPKRRATTTSRKPQSTDEHPHRGQRIFSTSITMAKRTLAQVIVLENLHLAKMEVQAILLEVMRERKLVTDFGAYSTPREFLVICILPTFNSPRLWDYLMDQFYISYKYIPSITPLPRSLSPILQLNDFSQLQSQASQVQLSTLIQSYISSILISLRLHPRVISTSISSTAVGDIRNFIRVMALRTGEKKYVNAEGVMVAIQRCTEFRVRMEENGEKITYEQVLKEVIENVRAPL